MGNKVLIIGRAHDGPDNETFVIKTPRQYELYYNLPYKQLDYVLGQSTSLTLDYTTSELLYDIVDEKKNYLYSPNITNSTHTLSYGQIGGSGYRSVTTCYYPNFEKEDLYIATRHFLESNIVPYVCRIAGELASSTPIANLIFEARHSGTKYNQVTITCVSNVVTIAGLDLEYPSFSTLFEDRDGFLQNINQAFTNYQIPVTCTACPTTLSNFSVTLSGGTDGEFSDTLLTTLFDQMRIPSDVSTILILGELDSDAQTVVQSFASENMRVQIFIPTPAPEVDVDTWEGSYTAVTHPSILYFIGDIQSQINGKLVVRSVAEGAALGMSLAQYTTSLSNLKIPCFESVTEYTLAELNTILDKGVNAPTRRIFNDIALYRGVTSTVENTTFRYVASLVISIARPYLDQLQLTTLSNTTVISNGLINTLQEELPFMIKVLEVTADIVDLVLYVKIVVEAEEEIQSIKFSIKY